MAQQKADDREFLNNIVANNLQVTESDERKAQVVSILQRVVQDIRGGPTKVLLHQLQAFTPGDEDFPMVLGKKEMAAFLLRAVQGEDGRQDQQQAEAGENGEQQNAGAVPGNVLPAGAPPPGWGDLVPNAEPQPQQQREVFKPLMQLRRQELQNKTQAEIVAMLVEEQANLEQAKRANDLEFLRYAREHLHTMAGKDEPLDQQTGDQWIWYFYAQVLQREIAAQQLGLTSTAGEANTQDTATENNGETAVGGATPGAATQSEGQNQHEDSASTVESSSDLEDYIPKKRFARKRKRKQNKKKKKRKRKRKSKRSRKGRSSTDDSSSDDSSSSSQEPNGRRVKHSTYGQNHYDQLTEFTADYNSYHEDGKTGDWPEDEAITFIAKKFARPGNKFAHKTLGIKRRFTTKGERDHARRRTAQIYEMAATVAELRTERHEQLSKEARRIEGASQAKKRRIKSRMRKIRVASVQEEQTLVAQIGVLCDLVLLGKKAWDQYHSHLNMEGQSAAVVESMGGNLHKSVASKAWKAAMQSAVTPAAVKPAAVATTPQPKTQQQQSLTPRPAKRRFLCNYCNKRGHYERECNSKKAGRPPHPKSKRARWNKEGGGIRITKKDGDS